MSLKIGVGKKKKKEKKRKEEKYLERINAFHQQTLSGRELPPFPSLKCGLVLLSMSPVFQKKKKSKKRRTEELFAKDEAYKGVACKRAQARAV
jgi:hypothetical protein